MANKTLPTRASVSRFLNAIEDEERRRDAKALHALLRRVSGAKAVMWGESLVGYGRYHYRYASGREGEFMRIGFSPRVQNLVVFIMPGFAGYAAQLEKLGRHRTGKSCLYIKRLADIDMAVLERLARKSLQGMRKRYPEG